MNTTTTVAIQDSAGFFSYKLCGGYLRRALFTVLFIVGLAGYGSVAYGQTTHYRFQLQNITNPAEAKMVTDIIRRVFNTTAMPFEVFPAFNDASDSFDFYASLIVTKEQLETALTAEGLVLISFSDSDKAEPKTEER